MDEIKPFPISSQSSRITAVRMMRLLALVMAVCIAGQAVLIIALTPTIAAELAPIGQSVLPGLRIVQELRTPGTISAVVWNSDGTRLAAASLGQPEKIPTIPPINIPNPFGGLITIWNSNGQLYRELQRPEAFFGRGDRFAFVGGGMQLVVPPSMASNDIAFSVLDAETGNLLRDVRGAYPGRLRNVNGATDLVVTPDETILSVIFGRAAEQPLALYLTREWTKLADLPDGQRPQTATFSNDGRLLAVGRSSRYLYVLIYDVSSISLLQQIDAFPDIVGGASSVAFNADNTLIAASSRSNSGIRRLPDGQIERLPNGNVHFVPPSDPLRIFQVKDGVRVATYGGGSNMTGNIAWSPDSRVIAFTTEYRFMHIWNPNPFQSDVSERVLPLSEPVGPIAFSPDSKRLAVGVGSVVQIYELTQ